MTKLEQLKEWNDAYRKGESIVSDKEYDILYDSLTDDEKEEFGIGYQVESSRKAKLPVTLASMNKVKTMEEIYAWMKSKGILLEDEVVLTPKYDGLSMCVEYNTLVDDKETIAYTRGNGTIGQLSGNHINEVMKRSTYVDDVYDLKDNHLIGEVIMNRNTFKKEYSKNPILKGGKCPKNPRNFIAGLFNSDDPSEYLQDVSFMSYGVGDESKFRTKTDMLISINKFNAVKVPFASMKCKELTEETLKRLFEEWNSDYEIDGIIVELNDYSKRKKLGRETSSGNPCFARAWKGFDAMMKETTIVGHTVKVSKEGKLAPVAVLDPVELDGVLVSNVTMNNFSMVVNEQWGIGTKIQILRSGMVIPRIVGTVDGIEPELPTHCPDCNTPVEWDDNKVHLICNNTWSCPAQRIQQMVSFFKILETDSLGEGIIEQLYSNGYDSIKKVIESKPEDLEKLDGFGKRKSKVVCDNITKKIKDVPLGKLQHAFGLFKGLGSKKLALLEQFDSKDKKPTLEQIVAIDGFSKISAESYLKSFDLFWETLETIPSITVSVPKEVKLEGNKCEGLAFCFTGVRDKELQEIIVAQGGKIASGVSKNTSHLIVKDLDSSSSKMKKAKDLGINIWELETLSQFLKEV